MANVNTTSTYLSSTGLTTAVVTDFFPDTDVPNFGSIRCVASVKMLLETALNPSGTAVRLNIPLFSVKGSGFAPIQLIQECVTTLTQTGTSTSTNLIASLSIAATPSTALAITTGTTNNLILNATGTTRAITGVGSIAVTGTAVLAAGQIQTDPINLVSTARMVVLPGSTLYLNLVPSGTLTTSTIYNGHYKFYVVGSTMSPSAVAV